MGVQMPVMAGLESSRQIRQMKNELAERRQSIVAMTANAMQGLQTAPKPAWAITSPKRSRNHGNGKLCQL